MATPITQDFLIQTESVTFPNAAAIDAFFATYQPGASFISWFNTSSDHAIWAGRQIPTTPDCAQRFAQFWDGAADLFGPAGPNVIQFLCLMGIMINEVSGDLIPLEEKVNGPNSRPPGIAYAFNVIPSIPKRSYNTLPGNRTALSLFIDPIYQRAHANEAMAERFLPPANLDPAWGGDVWPQGANPSTDPAVNGYIQQADFFKFRGRGLIQTTGRPNYLSLIHAVQAYSGNDPVITSYAAQWAGIAADDIATTSTNADWHAMFFSPSLTVPRWAIAAHNQRSGNYLALASTDPAALNGQGAGSIYRMGLKISGGTDYADTFQSRIGQLAEALQSQFPSS